METIFRVIAASLLLHVALVYAGSGSSDSQHSTITAASGVQLAQRSKMADSYSAQAELGLDDRRIGVGLACYELDTDPEYTEQDAINDQFLFMYSADAN